MLEPAGVGRTAPLQPVEAGAVVAWDIAVVQGLARSFLETMPVRVRWRNSITTGTVVIM